MRITINIKARWKKLRTTCNSAPGPIIGGLVRSLKKPMSPRLAKWIRIGFAGPGAVIISMVVMAGMALWLPGGAAGIDNLVLPLVLFPLIWAGLFFHACLDSRPGRIMLVALGLLVIHAGLVTQKFLDRRASAMEVHK